MVNLAWRIVQVMYQQGIYPAQGGQYKLHVPANAAHFFFRKALADTDQPANRKKIQR